MLAVLFLLPIPISLLLALAWAWWVSRPPRPADPTESVEAWTRAVSVLAAQRPPADSRRPVAPADDELARSA